MTGEVCNVCIKPLSAAPTTTLARLGLRLHVACWRSLTAWIVPPATAEKGVSDV